MTNPIYSIEAGSPQTTLSAAYTYGDASLAVVNSAVLPDAPNILSISHSSTSYITVKYESVVGNDISGLTFIDGDDTFEFPVGSRVARVWSKYDHDAFSDHISDLEDDKVDKAFGVANSVIITDGSGVISSSVIKTAFNSDVATESPLMDGIADVGDSLKLAKEDHVHPTDTTRAPLDVATISADGLMSSEDKTKLEGIAEGSQVNVLEGIQIDGVDLAITSKKSNIPLATSLLDGAMSSEDKESFDAHLVDTTNPHEVTKDQVGLGNCDNTSDANKPVSTAQATAIGLKVDKAQGVSNANKIVVTNPTTGVIETLAKKTAFNSDIATATPLVAGTAAVGVSAKLAKEDHVHPAQTTVSGNAGTATKLATTRAIDGVSFDGTAAISRYGVCATIAKTAAKVVPITGYTLVTGSVSVVKFTYGNVANSPTLNITSTGAKPITRKGVAISPEKIEVGGTYVFIYDGTNYEIIGSYFDNSPMTIHGMIIDETNSDPNACISYIGASAGLDLTARKAVFESSHPFVVVKAAEELFTVDPTDWSKKLDGTASGVTTDGLSLDGNFVIRYPTCWFRILTLGADIHSIEWTHDNPGSGNGWVCCHWRDGTIRDKVWVGVTKGVVSDNKLRAIYSETELPTVSLSSEQFYTAAQATGTAEGVTGENPYTITQPLVYIMRCILKYWTYGTLNLQTDVARGIVDDTTSLIGKRPVCVGVSPTGGYTQGVAASTQAYADNVSAVVCGEIDPYGNVWEHMIDIAYRFGEIAFTTDSADHFNVGTLTLTPDNWDSAIPATWSKVTGVGTTPGYIRKMLWNSSFPFISADVAGGSALTYWSDYTYRNAVDTIENKVPRCCISGGYWCYASGAGPAFLYLCGAVGSSYGLVGARLQIFSKE